MYINELTNVSIDKNGRLLARSNQPLTHGIIAWHYLTRLAYPLLHGTIVMRRDLIINTGGYNTNFSREQDGELFLRLIDTVHYANLPNKLYLQRSTRPRSAANKVFKDSYAATINIRRQCIKKLLGHDVSSDVLQALIFPTAHRHR